VDQRQDQPDGSEIPSWLSTPFAELPTHGNIGLQGKHAGRVSADLLPQHENQGTQLTPDEGLLVEIREFLSWRRLDRGISIAGMCFVVESCPRGQMKNYR
jgi:hypothetical protein